MRPSILSLALAGLCLSQSVLGSKHHQSHRRHHHKRGSSGKCHSSHHSGSTAGASQGGSPSSTPTASPAVVSSAGSPSSSAAASGSASDDPFQRTDYLTINGVGIGYLPDNGDSGGEAQDINEVNDYQGYKSFSVGLYAHVIESEAFDGAELYDLGASLLMGHSGLDPSSVDPSTIDVQKDVLFNQVVESGAVFIASVMPTMSWAGMTQDNNTQAVRIAKVLKRFTDAGVVTWLRYAHEANWYGSDGCTEAPGGGKVYIGGPENVKEGWAVVAAAVQEHAPEVKMYWSPNQDEIEQNAPDDLSTIDIVGIDWYPDSADQTLSGSYQWLHDKYASESVPFTVGETGSTKDISTRQQLLKTWTSASEVAKMPHFKVLNWFNYNKGSDFMLAGEACADCDESQVRQFFSELAD